MWGEGEMRKQIVAQRQIVKHKNCTINVKLEKESLNTKITAYMMNYNRAVMFRRRK
jgi:hypothetical protein